MTQTHDIDDHENTGKGTGASGGGSFGNEPGTPKTGGSDRNGGRSKDGDLNPPPDENHEKDQARKT